MQNLIVERVAEVDIAGGIGRNPSRADQTGVAGGGPSEVELLPATACDSRNYVVLSGKVGDKNQERNQVSHLGILQRRGVGVNGGAAMAGFQTRPDLVCFNRLQI